MIQTIFASYHQKYITHYLIFYFYVTISNESCVSKSSSQAQNRQQSTYVLRTVAGGSVAFTVALGIFFTCFYRRARPKKQYPVIKSMFFTLSPNPFSVIYPLNSQEA